MMILIKDDDENDNQFKLNWTFIRTLVTSIKLNVIFFVILMRKKKLLSSSLLSHFLSSFFLHPFDTHYLNCILPIYSHSSSSFSFIIIIIISLVTQSNKMISMNMNHGETLKYCNLKKSLDCNLIMIIINIVDHAYEFWGKKIPC